jgi:hypothetical protein
MAPDYRIYARNPSSISGAGDFRFISISHCCYTFHRANQRFCIVAGIVHDKEVLKNLHSGYAFQSTSFPELCVFAIEIAVAMPLYSTPTAWISRISMPQYMSADLFLEA